MPRNPILDNGKLNGNYPNGEPNGQDMENDMETRDYFWLYWGYTLNLFSGVQESWGLMLPAPRPQKKA